MVVGMQVLLVLGVLGDVQAGREVVAGHTGGDDGLLDDRSIPKIERLKQEKDLMKEKEEEDE